MTVWALLATNAAILIVCFVGLWLVCLKTRDVTPVDSFWAFGMVVMAVSTFLLAHGHPDRKLLLLALCTAWGLRLGGYMIWRWRSHGTDRRYAALLGRAKERRGWGFAKASGLLVFATQAPLLFIVGLPVQLGQYDMAPPLGTLAWVGASISIFGILFETVGDLQLVRFKRDPANQGKVMDRGLWRFTRHPNYFGDACAWWGMFLIVAETSAGMWSVVGPALLTWTLMKWSGAPTVEGKMRRTKPDYAAYVARTSGFVPWFPTPPRSREVAARSADGGG